MAFMQYLVFDGIPLPTPDSYVVDFKDVEADSSGETEAGTIQRDVVRSGVTSISVSFSVSPKWLSILAEFRTRTKMDVDYFDMETLEMRRTQMYMEGFRSSLVKDTSYKGLWSVSFTLQEF